MAEFTFQSTVPAIPGSIVSAALGVNAAGKFLSADLGKPVKLAAANNYVLCADGDEIEGFVHAIEPTTVNDGFGFGSVDTANRHVVEVDDANGDLVVGDLVIAAAQTALGTAGTAKVKKGVAAAQGGADPFAYTERTPNTFLWRVISLLDEAGADGESVLIARV